jgi:hypothetical protein
MLISDAAILAAACMIAENYVCAHFNTSVLNLHVWLHVHHVLSLLAHHLGLRLRVLVGSMRHHGHFAGVADLRDIALVADICVC